VPSGTVEGEQDDIARDIAAKIETDYDTARLKALIDAEGWNRS